MDVAKANSIKLAGSKERGSNSQQAGGTGELLFPKPGLEIKSSIFSRQGPLGNSLGMASSSKNEEEKAIADQCKKKSHVRLPSPLPLHETTC